MACSKLEFDPNKLEDYAGLDVSMESSSQAERSVYIQMTLQPHLVYLVYPCAQKEEDSDEEDDEDESLPFVTGYLVDSGKFDISRSKAICDYPCQASGITNISKFICDSLGMGPFLA